MAHDSHIKKELNIKNLAVGLPNGSYLQDVTLSLSPGTVAVVVAEPPESAQLLLECIAGKVKPASGCISNGDGKHFPESDISLVYGGPRFPEGLTVQEFLNQLALLHNDAHLGERMASAMGLIERKRFYLDELNATEQQLVRLACGMLAHPRICLVDKLDRDLSRQNKHAVYRVIRELREEGSIFLFTCDNFETAEAICNHVIILKDGLLEASDSPENIILSGQQWMRVEIFTEREFDTEDLRKAEFVNRVVRHGDRLDVFVDNKFASVYEILKFFEHASVPLRDLRTYRSTLADAIQAKL